MHDVIVVGGGPGGLHTSTLLARDGFDVTVLEEHQTTGEPVHCTGVLAAEAFDEFDVPRDAILNTLSTARFYSPAGLSVAHATPATEAVVIDRAVFDRGLHERAVAAGAEVRVGARVAQLDVLPHFVVARLGDGSEIRGRAAVLACGANYTLQRRLGLGMPRVFLRSAQRELPATETGDTEVHFGDAVSPKGFAWVVPVERREGRFARVGLMCDGHAATHFKRFAAQVSARWGLALGASEIAAMQPRQKILPLAPIARTYGDRLIAVGDAAGLVKATTGGGIYYSLVSAAAAATVLGEALRYDTLGAATLKRYQKMWKATLGAELRAQLALRLVAHRLGDRDIDALFDLARTNGVMPIVRATARFNEHRHLIVSLFKHGPVRRLFFKQLASRTAAASLQ
jgi:geranylgeranyl reductase family protein